MDQMGAPARQLVKTAGVVPCSMVPDAQPPPARTARSKMDGVVPPMDTIICSQPKNMTIAREDHQLRHRLDIQLQRPFQLLSQHVLQDQRVVHMTVAARSTMAKGVHNLSPTAMKTIGGVAPAMHIEMPKRARLMITVLLLPYRPLYRPLTKLLNPPQYRPLIKLALALRQALDQRAHQVLHQQQHQLHQLQCQVQHQAR